jgi:hypothetical protein
MQLCSLSLVAGLLICLHSAAKITHKTQAITSIASAWHADATINTQDCDQENPRPPGKAYLQQQQQQAPLCTSSGDESDDDETSPSEDSLDTSSKFTSFQATHISYQKRQALGKHARTHHVSYRSYYGFCRTHHCSRSWRFQ